MQDHPQSTAAPNLDLSAPSHPAPVPSPAPGRGPLFWSGHLSSVATLILLGILSLLQGGGGSNSSMPEAPKAQQSSVPVWAIVAYDSTDASQASAKGFARSVLAREAARAVGVTWVGADVSDPANARASYVPLAEHYGLPCLMVQIGDTYTGAVSFVPFPLPKSEGEALAQIRKALHR